MKTNDIRGQKVVLNEGEPEETRMRITGITRSGFDLITLSFVFSRSQLTIRQQNSFLEGVSEDGQVFELHPDGNSFDFFKGLIKRKISP